MIPWARQQKFKYTIVFVTIILLVFSIPAYLIISNYLYQPPSCLDEEQNQDETGIDCGGICQVACLDTVEDLTIVWSRVFKIDDGVYDVAAFVENSNHSAGVKNLQYSFKIQDSAGKILLERTGSTYVNQREAFVIFEPNIRLPETDNPQTVFFTIDSEQLWVDTHNVATLPIVAEDKELSSLSGRPRLDVTLSNTNELQSYTDLDIVALVTDLKGNVVAAASTFVDRIEEGDKTDAFFTWNIPFPGNENVSCNDPNVSVDYLFPADVMLVFDRSGSMNDDGGTPLQPITDAKLAARVFVDKMQPVDQVGLVTFATEASDPIDQRLTLDSASAKVAIDAITIGTPDNQQHTNLGAGIREAARELNSSNHNKEANKAMIVLTDGITSRPLNPDNPDDDDVYPEQYALAQAQGAQRDDITVYVVGLGQNLNSAFLQNGIASHASNYYYAATSNELNDIYSDIARAVCENRAYTVKLFVRQNSFYH